MPDLKVLLELFPPQIQIAIGQRNFIVDLGFGIDMEGRGLGRSQDPQLGNQYFDGTGFQFRVDAFPLQHFAFGDQHIFAFDGFGFLKDSAVGPVVKGQLENAGTVPQVNEN